MKQRKNDDGTVTVYNWRNKELNQQLRQRGHRVMADRKKKGRKYACRGKGAAE